MARLISSIFSLVILAFCCAVFIAGGLALGREAQVAILFQASTPQRALAMRQFNPDWQAASVSGLTQVTSTCADLLLTDEMVRLSPPLRKEITVSCRLAMQAILQTNPNFARALAVALVVGEAPLSAKAYAQAQAAARYEPWPLEVRVLAADRALRQHRLGQKDAALPENMAVLLRLDLQYMMQVDWGQAVLAQLYAQGSPLGSLIQDMAQQQATLFKDQARSLNNG